LAGVAEVITWIVDGDRILGVVANPRESIRLTFMPYGSSLFWA
jgi:hypothetical protein